jgi:hypothetical protein
MIVRPAPFVAAPSALTDERKIALAWLLRLATAGTFVGHGAYGAFAQKPSWYGFFACLGVAPGTVDAHHLMLWAGAVEMGLGLLVLVAPIRALLLVLFAWKTATEWVWYPMAGLPMWEFVERWSNYTAPLALLVVRGWPRSWGAWLR